MFQHVMCRVTDLPTSSGTAVVQHVVSCSVENKIYQTIEIRLMLRDVRSPSSHPEY